jgi:pyruvate/2-oxoacid:ferredoxin oxidoreductase alpha subunit
MLTLTIQGKSVGELQEGVVLAMKAFNVPLQMVGTLPVPASELESKTLASGAVLHKDTTVEETTTPKKRGPKPKETVAVVETPAVVAPASAATFESMKKALQELAGKHKTNEEGMTAVSKLLAEKFSIKMVRDVPDDKYQAVQDAAVAAMGNVGADPFKV